MEIWHHIQQHHLLHQWILFSLALWLASAIVSGFRIQGLWNTIVVAALFGIVNVLLGWFFTAVIVIGTLGIALLVMFITRCIVNAICLMIVSWLTPRVVIDRFSSAFWAALTIGLIGLAFEMLKF